MILPDNHRNSKLPDGKLCLDCSNYQVQCRAFLAGEKPFDGNSQFCYWSPHKFNQPFGATATTEDREALKAYRRSR